MANRTKQRNARGVEDGAVVPLGRDGRISSLRAGAHAPEFRLKDSDGAVVSLSAALRESPVVLCFLNTHQGGEKGDELRTLEEKADDIVKAGASVLVLSPGVLALKAPSAPFTILADTSSETASAYGLCPPSPGSDVLRAGAPESRWPCLVPATFVIDQRSRIVLSLTDAAFDSEIVLANVMGALGALRRR